MFESELVKDELIILLVFIESNNKFFPSSRFFRRFSCPPMQDMTGGSKKATPSGA